MIPNIKSKHEKILIENHHWSLSSKSRRQKPNKQKEKNTLFDHQPPYLGLISRLQPLSIQILKILRILRITTTLNIIAVGHQYQIF